MQSLAVSLQLLQHLETTEVRIAPGRVLSVRVIEMLPGGRGTLSIAGAAVEAQVPPHLRPGQELRLQVKDVHGGRVTLGVLDLTPPSAPAQVVPLPGGGTITVRRDTTPDGQDETGGEAGRRGSSGDAHTVALRYDAPRLGAVDLTFQMDAATLTVRVTVPRGASLDALSADAQTLRETLVRSTERAVAVTVGARHDPFDAYA